MSINTPSVFVPMAALALFAASAFGVLRGEMDRGEADSWRHIDDDVRALRETGQSTYRFGIEWARIDPNSDTPNEGALASYDDVVAIVGDGTGLIPPGVRGDVHRTFLVSRAEAIARVMTYDADVDKMDGLSAQVSIAQSTMAFMPEIPRDTDDIRRRSISIASGIAGFTTLRNIIAENGLADGADHNRARILRVTTSHAQEILVIITNGGKP
ncbi:family 1 glycosylhydrolase [Pendulispora brunnea]|uniref:Family 1 glycosylhydrolase n=1 Tax=Pendulispora brunnea TaxID=2905690 RepID=A0ABZ2K2K5_9BACT